MKNQCMHFKDVLWENNLAHNSVSFTNVLKYTGINRSKGHDFWKRGESTEYRGKQIPKSLNTKNPEKKEGEKERGKRN